MSLLFNPQKSHRRASAEAMKTYKEHAAFCPIRTISRCSRAKIQIILESYSLLDEKLKIN